MPDAFTKWKELKSKFLRDLAAGEQLFFIKKARECVHGKGYPVSEDLFNYCYYLTLRERLRLIDPQGGEGMMRFMLVASRQEVEAEVKSLEMRLEEKKRPAVDAQGDRMLDYFSR